MIRDRQTAIGAFVFGAFILALGAVILFGNFRLFHPTVRAAVIFQGSVSGLSVGAPVTFRGVRVGAVEGILLQFDPQTQAAYIPVTLQLEPERVRVAGDDSAARKTLELPPLVTRGLRAQLITQSFVTGQSQIDLDFDPSSSPVLHPNITSLPEIPTRLSTVPAKSRKSSAGSLWPSWSATPRVHYRACTTCPKDWITTCHRCSPAYRPRRSDRVVQSTLPPTRSPICMAGWTTP